MEQIDEWMSQYSAGERRRNAIMCNGRGFTWKREGWTGRVWNRKRVRGGERKIGRRWFGAADGNLAARLHKLRLLG